MTTKDQESKALADTFEQREAGVAELFDFYMGIESVYAAAAKAIVEDESSTTSNSTNQR